MKYLNFFIYFFYLQYVGITLLFKLLTNSRGGDVLSRMMQNFFNLKYRMKINSHKISKKKCMFLVNHNGWADFFVDATLTNGASYISRYGVCFILLFMGLWSFISKYVTYFNRSGNTFKVLEEKIIKIMDDTYNKQIIIYPEGTRNPEKKKMKLKSGCIRIAYNNKIPCQIMIVSDKEKIVSEKEWLIQKNLEPIISASKIIHPKNYKSFEDFFNKIKYEWNKNWNNAYDDKIVSTEYLVNYGQLKKNSYLKNNFSIRLFQIIVSFLIIFLARIYLY
jgi:1-acyl-sn-glycerol-3-phosphate acyltransferase